MQEQILTVRIRQKYDTADNWSKNNPVLLAGEIGIESNTNMIKIGNGTSHWNDLTYAGGGGGEGGSVIVDTTLSTESSNPVANRVITEKLDQIQAMLERLDKVKVESEADFILNGKYVLESDWDAIVNGTYTLK